MKAALLLVMAVSGGGVAAAAQNGPTPPTRPAPVIVSDPAASDPARLKAARQVVAEGWAGYDEDGNGTLSPLEFGTWVMTAQGQVPARNGRRGRWGGPSPATVLNATSAAFAKADANGDRAVSRDELIAFLAG